MKYKVGQILYDASTDVDEDTDRLSGKITEHHIRTIRGGRIYASQKIKYVSWVKRSTKHFDWGWAPNVPHWLRTRWLVGDEPYSLATTKRGAWVKWLRTLRFNRKRYVARGSEFVPSVDREIAYTQQKIKSMTRAAQ